VLDNSPHRVGPKSLRPAILKELGMPESAASTVWPREGTIQTALRAVRRERSAKKLLGRF
jgi:hypothetical protein